MARATVKSVYPKIADQPSLITTNTAQKPNTTEAVFPVVVLRDPAIFANPIENRIKSHMVKISSDPAKDLITAEASDERNAATFDGTIPAGCVGSMLRKPSSSRIMREAIITMLVTTPREAQLHDTTERIFLKVVFA